MDPAQHDKKIVVFEETDRGYTTQITEWEQPNENNVLPLRYYTALVCVDDPEKYEYLHKLNSLISLRFGVLRFYRSALDNVSGGLWRGVAFIDDQDHKLFAIVFNTCAKDDFNADRTNKRSLAYVRRHLKTLVRNVGQIFGENL